MWGQTLLGGHTGAAGTYPPMPEVWGFTTPAQSTDAMAASTEEPCLLSTSTPSAVQRAASVTTAPRWKSCQWRESCGQLSACTELQFECQ